MKYFKMRFVLIGLGIALWHPHSLPAQLVLGQYEDEAPVASWNRFGVTTAASLGMGGSHFALAGDGSAGMVNPALLASLPRFTLALNGSLTSADFFRYGPVNTGVFYSQGNSRLQSASFDAASISMRFREWTIALNYARIEDLGRPPARLQAADQGVVYYQADYEQNGGLQQLNFALSRRIGRKLSLGIGFNFVFGKLERRLDEEYIFVPNVTSSTISQKYSGFCLGGGMTFDFSSRLTAALVFRAPYTKKARSHSLLFLSNPEVYIPVSADSRDGYRQPLVLGLGMRCQIIPRLQAVCDLAFFNWSRYRVTYFEEERERRFKDTLAFSVGAEYSLRIRGKSLHLPLRAGCRYDPQPMISSNSSYWNYSVGCGLHWPSLRLDAAAGIGRENGSGQSLAVKRFALSLGVCW